MSSSIENDMVYLEFAPYRTKPFEKYGNFELFYCVRIPEGKNKAYVINSVLKHGVKCKKSEYKTYKEYPKRTFFTLVKANEYTYNVIKDVIQSQFDKYVIFKVELCYTDISLYKDDISDEHLIFCYDNVPAKCFTLLDPSEYKI